MPGSPRPVTEPRVLHVRLVSSCPQLVIVKVQILLSLVLSDTDFYLVCQIGCTQCADGTGDCITCKSGFTQDTNDRTKCDPPQSPTTSGQVCPVGSFSNGTTCSPCSSSCQTCTGGTSNDCIICAAGLFTFNGKCVSANSNGVCEGSGLIADNNKRECDGKSQSKIHC